MNNVTHDPSFFSGPGWTIPRVTYLGKKPIMFPLCVRYLETNVVPLNLSQLAEAGLRRVRLIPCSQQSVVDCLPSGCDNCRNAENIPAEFAHLFW
jgi:hypothetical protein